MAASWGMEGGSSENEHREGVKGTRLGRWGLRCTLCKAVVGGRRTVSKTKSVRLLETTWLQYNASKSALLHIGRLRFGNSVRLLEFGPSFHSFKFTKSITWTNSALDSLPGPQFPTHSYS